MVSKFISDMKKVWNVTRKPSKKDYLITLKIVLVGLVIIGFIGFIIYLLWQLLLIKLFA